MMCWVVFFQLDDGNGHSISVWKNKKDARQRLYFEMSEKIKNRFGRDERGVYGLRFIPQHYDPSIYEKMIKCIEDEYGSFDYEVTEMTMQTANSSVLEPCLKKQKCDLADSDVEDESEAESGCDVGDSGS